MAHSNSRPELETGLADVLAAAWPGIKIRRLDLQGDTRSSSAYGAELRCGSFSVNLEVSADPAALVRHGLLTQSDLDSLPASGVRSPVRYEIHRGKRVTRLDCYWIDPHDAYSDVSVRPPYIQRVVDRVAEAIAAHTLRTLHG